MKGTRPLDNHEIRRVSACFTGTFEARNRGLFMLGVSTGGRISELLSLTIGDVWQNRAAATDLLYNRSIVKGGEVSRAIPVEALFLGLALRGYDLSKLRENESTPAEARLHDDSDRATSAEIIKIG